MTLNLRGPDDSPPHDWPSRLPVVARIVSELQPDVIGTQEGLYPRLTELAGRVGRPRYSWVGLGREGGSHSEFVAVFGREDHLDPVEFDHFWLSDSPRTIGSVWPEGNRDNPRMVTWVRWRRRRDGRSFVHVNTHFDDQSEIARRRSADALARFCCELLEAGDSVVVSGDFNAAPTSEPYRILRRVLVDTWPASRPTRIATFHNYRSPTPTVGGDAAIDWILCSRDLTPLDCTVVTTTEQQDGQFLYPSDHWPVVCDLELP